MAPKTRATAEKHKLIHHFWFKPSLITLDIRINSDDDTPHSDTKRASTNAAPSVLGQPTPVDTLSLNPLNSFEMTADSAALHELLMPAVYERITNYEIAIGVDFQLENLAIANPADYELRGNIVFRKGGNKPARFSIIGCVTDQSALCYRLINKRHSVNIIPSIVGWGRATGVIQELLGDVSAYIFRGGLSFSTMGENRPMPANIPVSRKKDDSIQWDTFAARTPDKPVPVYDTRSVDFDIKNFQCLPNYDGELDSGMVVMVMFTLGCYSAAVGEKLSLNVQAAVAMHNAVPEEDGPSETIIDAKFPLPVN
ncbi:hypothetical protein B0H14DRAFT_2563685 [Mycena olivaceomarginata]|nr:hypothetical protein B0H14DRAFT_2563685 [Mycena olivaceomarginata]